MVDEGRYRVVVIGSSLGGVEALQVVLGGLRTVLPVPVLVAHHVGPSGSALDRVLHRHSRLPVAWAADGTAAQPGRVYLCPPRHELRLEPDGTLTVQPHGRPSSLGTVDATFTAAAAALGEHVLALVLSGMGHDGRAGAGAVKDAGGTVLVQDELTSLAFGMPEAVVGAGLADLVLPLAEIPDLLDRVVGGGARLPLPGVADLESAFAAGGELGALMAATDWSRTPLGPVEGWPVVLRATVATVLASRLAMVVLWGEELCCLYNDAYRDLVGDRHPELLGRPLYAVLPEVEELLDALFRSVRRGESRLVEDHPTPLRHRDDIEERFYLTAMSPLRDGPRIGGVLTVAVETTARVQSARRLATLHGLAAVDDAEGEATTCARVADVLAENPDDLPFALLYLTDLTGTELHLAGAAGLSAGAAGAPRRLSAHATTTWPVTAAVRHREALIVDDVRARVPGLPAAQRALVIPAGQRADGVPPAVLVLGLQPTIRLDGAYRGFLDLVAEQVGASVLAARRQQDARERIAALAALDRVKTEFFAGVSHEFRTPLTLLLGPLEELLDTTLTPAQVQSARLAHRNALRLLKLVNTLLEFAQLEQGRIAPRFVDTDLSALTADVVSVFRSAVEQAGLSLNVACPPLPRTVPVDQDMWERVVLNLVGNALKHTFTGAITVGVRSRLNHVELTVADTGVGIPEADLPHVFTRFHRVRGARARSHEGSGVGLALVRELVTLHRGSVRVRSTVGQGSTFTVWLPLTHPHRTGSDAEPATGDERQAQRRSFAEEAQLWLAGDHVPVDVADAAPPPPPLPGHRPAVLLVDDNPDMRRYIHRLLSDRYDITLAADGTQALAELAGRPFDLVLTDVLMPEVDGLELLARIRTDPALRATPVVLLTGGADSTPTVRGLVAGAHDYIVKPFTARELVARVEAQLALARLRANGRD
ncbi:MAG: chemotaxis protein CheB [Pseudonocardia sp.]